MRRPERVHSASTRSGTAVHERSRSYTSSSTSSSCLQGFSVRSCPFVTARTALNLPW